MNIRVSLARTAAAVGLTLAVLAGTLAGCSSSEPETSTTSGTTAVSGSTTVTSAPDITATTSSLLSEWDKKLNMVASLQNELATVLLEEDAASDDPRMGVIYGLRACTHGLAGRDAIEGGDLELADTAVEELRYSLNLARNVATGTVGDTIAAARAIIDTLGRPSSAPDEAAAILDEFLLALDPLIDEAETLVPTTSTT